MYDQVVAHRVATQNVEQWRDSDVHDPELLFKGLIRIPG